MATARIHGVMRRLWHTVLADATLSDGDLLQRYLAQRDETAFAALVRRHGRDPADRAPTTSRDNIPSSRIEFRAKQTTGKFVGFRA